MTSSLLEDKDGSILLEAQMLTHGDRNTDYGHPLDDYSKNAGMISALFAHKLKAPLTAADVALMMVCIKLSRQVHRPKRDNMVDAAGYAWVAQACVEETERRDPKKPLTFMDIPVAGDCTASQARRFPPTIEADVRRLAGEDQQAQSSGTSPLSDCSIPDLSECQYVDVREPVPRVTPAPRKLFQDY